MKKCTKLLFILFIIDFIIYGDKWASTAAAIVTNKMAKAREKTYLNNNGVVCTFIAFFIKILRIIFKEKPTEITAIKIKIGMINKFCGNTVTNERKKPFHPI